MHTSRGQINNESADGFKFLHAQFITCRTSQSTARDNRQYVHIVSLARDKCSGPLTIQQLIYEDKVIFDTFL